MSQYTYLPCLVCGKSLPLGHGSSHNQPSILNQDWDGGGSLEITCGFSSSHDMETFHGVVCDECLDKHRDRLAKVTWGRIVHREAFYND